jgi:hypothetical protein
MTLTQCRRCSVLPTTVLRPLREARLWSGGTGSSGLVLHVRLTRIPIATWQQSSSRCRTCSALIRHIPPILGVDCGYIMTYLRKYGAAVHRRPGSVYARRSATSGVRLPQKRRLATRIICSTDHDGTNMRSRRECRRWPITSGAFRRRVAAFETAINRRILLIAQLILNY